MGLPLVHSCLPGLPFPLLPTSCRFQPTCSHYSHDAVTRYGVKKGAWLGAKRLARCRPFGGGGYDPVP